MLDKYIFPAIFEAGDEHGYCITFPDLPGIVTSGETIEESLAMAKEALELHLYGMEEDEDAIPEPTPPNKIAVPEGGFVNLIEVWMPPVRDEMANRAVKKTLTIPQWLNDLAERRKVNYSHLLQESLKHHLGVHKPPYLKK
ncbi:putative RNase H-like HicB family nuclease [Sporomusaceae bacterium BoRhaA]|uniref:type II toxin-antitoxin system HicB family antitoxin n=1 Tax=Pelorhabdus rhamnosifermentans TaxID=2772457 RepID=UPI001C0631CF|nr:type II toxin-antitoxin system HicB family antitoxin [Pelorhabdus rhamnosifermentans]MBU2704113.1 putative RNase H-like HicB family nuclease [Pelorhabdus rhamnosifermentans]